MSKYDNFIDLLGRVTHKSKMNWCDIRFDQRGNPYAYDLENRCKMAFKEAVGQIYEGACDLTNLGFSEAEEEEFYTYCKLVLRGDDDDEN